MLHQDDMRIILNKAMVLDRVYPLCTIYGLVEKHAKFDPDDLVPTSHAQSDIDLRWKTTVRRALFGARQKGQVEHVRPSYYKRTGQIQ